MTDPLETFRAEANEHLGTLEQALLEMEESPDDPELIAQAFRAMHTIKGAGGMFGFDDLSNFTHHLETAFDQVRNGEFPVTSDLISVVLDAKDHIEGMLEHTIQTPEQSATGEKLLARLQAILPDGDRTEEKVTTASALQTNQPIETGDDQAWRIKITPHQNTFEEGFDILPILRELSEAGPSHVRTVTDSLPSIDEMNPESCYLSWEITLTTSLTLDSLKDTFIFVQDDWHVEFNSISNAIMEDNDQIGELLVNRGDVSKSQVEQVLNQRTRTGELLADAGMVSDENVEAALEEQQFLRQTREAKKRQDQDSTVRVPTDKLNSLMDLVGELVIVQARLNQLSLKRDDEEILSISEELDRLTTNLRDNTFDIRMLPIGTTFSRFRRLVRDLSRDLGKEVKLITEGAETELDKMVIDRLADPMVHLIRNSIDHGIETPAVRAERGKPTLGTIHLSAIHAESHVIIRIHDDGAGLDAEKLRQKAIEKNLIEASDRLTREECYNLIFQPGFSTAKAVTDVSGRGVGMDVVRRSIESLRGEVNISSEKGAGSTIEIKLPMTLAIIEGLMVAVSEERYVMPLGVVEECIELTEGSELGADTTRNQQNRLVKIRGELVPFIRLRDWFSVPGEPPEIEQIVITRLGDRLFGLCVDEVIGQYQTVIKSLGKLYHNKNTCLAGATIMGDGGVAMILDINQLINTVQVDNQVVH